MIVAAIEWVRVLTLPSTMFAGAVAIAVLDRHAGRGRSDG